MGPIVYVCLLVGKRFDNFIRCVVRNRLVERDRFY